MATHPIGEDNANLIEYLNIQKDIEKSLQNRENISSRLYDIDKNLESEIKRRYAEEFRLGTLIQRNLEARVVAEEELKRHAINGNAQQRQIQQQILDSINQEIADNTKLLAIKKQVSEYEMAAIVEKMEKQKKYQDLMIGYLKKSKVFFIEDLDRAHSINSTISKMGPKMSKVAGILTGVVLLFEKIASTFIDLDKAAWEFRKTMGSMREGLASVRQGAEHVAIKFANIGVTIDKVYKSIKSLGTEMGGIINVTDDLRDTVSILNAQLDVAEEISAGFLRNMAALSKSSMESQKSMAYLAVKMSNAAGVPLADVMGDIAKMSETSVTMVSRIPGQLIKSAVEARRLNSSLEKMSSAGSTLLGFTENIQSEMEASVLLGHSINLQRARELAYKRDIVGANKEILRISKMVNFESLDKFQMEAFAKATGYSADELLKMVQASKQLELARNSSDPKIRAAVEQYEQLKNSNESIAKSSADNLEILMRQQANQERLVAVQNKWNQLWMKLSEPLLKIADITLSIVTPLVDAFPIVATLFGYFSKFLPTAGKFLGPISLGLKAFGKFLGPIGIAITAVQALYSAFKRIGSIWECFFLHGYVMQDYP